jgi:hypothetical protein
MVGTLLNLIPAAFVASLVAWRLYRRVRRHVGPQPLRPRRMKLRIAFLVVISGLILVSISAPRSVIGFGAGVVLGVPLALTGLRLTRFETTPEGRFYVPNTYIGIGLSVLLVARVTYRVTVLSTVTQTSNRHPLGEMQSAITLLIFGLLASYYIAYYVGVLIQSRNRALTT